ncbi:glycosyltransferase [Microaceticoccus formicicus]|uniref:glycosyltransferase n=1 Tax=Microaceticoccus formicicus TaxID=3118105 RepID=UPI003CD049EA|nr:glycosyltransferase [Peptoniphilaceae bacterium AMB_02]
MNFSVLMSVYINEKPEYLSRSLDSILKFQSIKPTEVILIQDGKLTEELYGVIEKYTKLYPSILKTYKLENNVGLGKALNIGLKKCNYDLIARMDTDDIAVENRFELQLDYLLNNEDISAVGGNIIEFDKGPEDVIAKKVMPTDKDEVYNYAKKRCPINHMTVMFRKNHILDVGGYVPLLLAEDYYLWVRLLYSGYKIANIDEVLCLMQSGRDMYERRGKKSYYKNIGFIYKEMYENKMINKIQQIIYTLGMKTFISMPPIAKKVIYQNFLRNKQKGDIY